MIGVYFLRKKNKIVYVGQSTNIKQRICQHKSDPKKDFDNYTYVECKKELLDTTEEYFIFAHNPIFNIRKAVISTGISTPKMNTIKINPELHRELKIMALEVDRTVESVTHEAVSNFILMQQALSEGVKTVGDFAVWLKDNK